VTCDRTWIKLLPQSALLAYNIYTSESKSRQHVKYKCVLRKTHSKLISVKTALWILGNQGRIRNNKKDSCKYFSDLGSETKSSWRKFSINERRYLKLLYFITLATFSFVWRRRYVISDWAVLDLSTGFLCLIFNNAWKFCWPEIPVNYNIL